MFVLCVVWDGGKLKWLQFILVMYECCMAIVVGIKSNAREFLKLIDKLLKESVCWFTYLRTNEVCWCGDTTHLFLALTF